MSATQPTPTADHVSQASTSCLPGLLAYFLKASVFVLYLICFTVHVYAQSSCNCPAPSECKPCAGGISQLTLRYNGFLPALVLIRDNGGAIFIETLQPSEVFTVSGQSNGRFAANQIYIFANGIFSAEIKVNCSLEFDPTASIGWFTIMGARSKDGGTLCCTASAGDTASPVISGCPSDIVIAATSQCTASATWQEPRADDCHLKSFTSTKPPGATFPIGTTRVTYTATDASNNSSTCSFNVVVQDKSAPVVSNCPAQISMKAGDDCKAKPTWTPPTFTDNCGAVTVTSTHTPGSELNIGTIEVIYTARDNAGNRTQCKFNIVVEDSSIPVVATKPGDVSVPAGANCNAAASWAPPTFTDCSSVTITSSHKPGSIFPMGTTEVTYTAKDKTGNTARYTFNVTVKSAAAPVFSNCPSDVLIKTTELSGAEAMWEPPVASDDCEVPVITASHDPGTPFPVGNTTVTYTAIDQSGNSTTCNFTVSVQLEDAELSIPQIITPDGNGVNDAWQIENIRLYHTNKVVIVDRWGSVIYSASNYNNDNTIWDGRDTSGKVVPTGTYFFTISVRSGDSWIEKKGFIEIIQ
jgi:gliding motility-associated-like protein